MKTAEKDENKATTLSDFQAGVICGLILGALLFAVVWILMDIAAS